MASIEEMSDGRRFVISELAVPGALSDSEFEKMSETLFMALSEADWCESPTVMTHLRDGVRERRAGIAILTLMFVLPEPELPQEVI